MKQKKKKTCDDKVRPSVGAEYQKLNDLSDLHEIRCSMCFAKRCTESLSFMTFSPAAVVIC